MVFFNMLIQGISYMAFSVMIDVKCQGCVTMGLNEEVNTEVRTTLTPHSPVCVRVCVCLCVCVSVCVYSHLSDHSLSPFPGQQGSPLPRICPHGVTVAALYV